MNPYLLVSIVIAAYAIFMISWASISGSKKYNPIEPTPDYAWRLQVYKRPFDGPIRLTANEAVILNGNTSINGHVYGPTETVIMVSSTAAMRQISSKFPRATWFRITNINDTFAVTALNAAFIISINTLVPDFAEGDPEAEVQNAFLPGSHRLDLNGRTELSLTTPFLITGFGAAKPVINGADIPFDPAQNAFWGVLGTRNPVTTRRDAIINVSGSNIHVSGLTPSMRMFVF